MMKANRYLSGIIDDGMRPSQDPLRNYSEGRARYRSAAAALVLAASPSYGQILPDSATAIAQLENFCTFAPASIQDRQITVGNTLYEAPFTFNRTLVSPGEVAELDSMLTTPLIPNALLIYFSPDTVSAADRALFESIPDNRIVNVPTYTSRLALVEAVEDSVAGWIKPNNCQVTSAGEGVEAASWGHVKARYHDDSAIRPQTTPQFESWANSGHRPRRFR